MPITFTILRSARGLIRGGSNCGGRQRPKKIVAYGIFFDPRDSVSILLTDSGRYLVCMKESERVRHPRWLAA